MMWVALLALGFASNPLVHPAQNDPISRLRVAYRAAARLDWSTDSGKRKCWQLIGDALAHATLEWPLRSMSLDRIRTKIELLGVKAGIVDDSDPPKRSMLSICYGTAPVRGARDGVILLAVIDRSYEKKLSDSAALLYLRTEKGFRVCSVLKVGEFQDELPGPATARKVKGGLLVSGPLGWIGNGPSASVLFFRRKSDRWACVSAAETNFEAWGGIPFRSSHGVLTGSIVGRTYPDHINVCHADANVAMQGTFRFDGKRVTLKQRTLKNAWHILDRMAGLASTANFRGFRSYCRSRTLAKEAYAILRSNVKELSASNSDSICSLDDHVFDIRNSGDRFIFRRTWTGWKLASISQTPLARRKLF